ncbi:unnamed protein product [Lampetra fluviatilis]
MQQQQQQQQQRQQQQPPLHECQLLQQQDAEPPTNDEDGEGFTLVTSHKRRVKPGHGGGGQAAPNLKRSATVDHEPDPKVAEQDEQCPPASAIPDGVVGDEYEDMLDGDPHEDSTVTKCRQHPRSYRRTPPQHPQGKRNHQPVRRLTAPCCREATKASSPHPKGEQKNLHYQRAATLFPMGPCHHQRQTRFLPSHSLTSSRTWMTRCRRLKERTT